MLGIACKWTIVKTAIKLVKLFFENIVIKCTDKHILILVYFYANFQKNYVHILNEEIIYKIIYVLEWDQTQNLSRLTGP